MLIADKAGILEKLKSRTIIDPDTHCWLWQGAKQHETHGHGSIRLQKYGPKYFIHRLSAYIYHDMDINSDELVCHQVECPNKHCWNPNHIYRGTHKTNSEDANRLGMRHDLGAIHRNKTHCKRGHEFTEENTQHYNGERRCRECLKLRLTNPTNDKSDEV